MSVKAWKCGRFDLSFDIASQEMQYLRVNIAIFGSEIRICSRNEIRINFHCVEFSTPSVGFSLLFPHFFAI